MCVCVCVSVSFWLFSYDYVLMPKQVSRYVDVGSILSSSRQQSGFILIRDNDEDHIPENFRLDEVPMRLLFSTSLEATTFLSSLKSSNFTAEIKYKL